MQRRTDSVGDVAAACRYCSDEPLIRAHWSGWAEGAGLSIHTTQGPHSARVNLEDGRTATAAVSKAAKGESPTGFDSSVLRSAPLAQLDQRSRLLLGGLGVRIPRGARKKYVGE